MIRVREETMSLQEYLVDKTFCNDTKHAQIKKNVLTATRNFDNRVKEFMKHIVMAKENPMNTKLFNYRVEFQARGAAHVHGVLWMDFDEALPNNLYSNIIESAFNKFRHDENLTPERSNDIMISHYIIVVLYDDKFSTFICVTLS